MTTLMNQAEYARHRGVSAEAVRKAIASGRISLIDGKIDPEVADIQWAKNTNQTKAAAANSKRMQPAVDIVVNQPGLPPVPALEDYMHWKTRRERAEAIRAEQDQEREAGNLVYRDSVERTAKTAARLLRDQFLAVPSRLAAELATMTDAAAIEQKLRVEIRVVLMSMDRLIKQEASDET